MLIKSEHKVWSYRTKLDKKCFCSCLILSYTTLGNRKVKFLQFFFDKTTGQECAACASAYCRARKQHRASTARRRSAGPWPLSSSPARRTPGHPRRCAAVNCRSVRSSPRPAQGWNVPQRLQPPSILMFKKSFQILFKCPFIRLYSD